MSEKPRLYQELQDMIDQILDRLGTPTSDFANLFSSMLQMLQYIAIVRRYVDLDQGFMVVDTFEGVSNGSSSYIYIENPENSGKVMEIIELSLIGSAKGKVRMYTPDRFTVTSLGTDVEPICLNGNDVQSSMIIRKNGTYNITGNPKGRNIITGGEKSKAIGGELAVAIGLKIRQGKKILIEILNDSGSSADYSFRILWVEYNED